MLYRLISLIIIISNIFTQDDVINSNQPSDSTITKINKNIYLEIAGLDKGWGRVGGIISFDKYYFEPYLLGGYCGELGILFQYKLTNAFFGIGIS